MIVALLSLAGGAAAQEADLVLSNGKVLTVDDRFSIATAVAVKDGRIIAVGGEDVTEAFTARRSIDLGGRVLMPGFIDTHVHIRSDPPRSIDVERAKSIADIQEMLRKKAAELGPGEWITGFGWDEAQLAEKRNIVRADLDAAAPANPVVLTRAGAHSSVGNSRALEIAGIDRNTPDPDEGLIERDARGDPNGIVRERSDLFYRHVPADTWEALRDAYVARLEGLFELGITSIMEATGSIDDEPVGLGGIEKPGPGLTFRRLRELHEAHDLPRTTLYISFPGAERLAAFPHHTGYGDERVRLGPIGETAVDGGFTGPTAWTLADYRGLPGFRGKGRFTDAELQAIVDVAARHGWQMGLHAIGDAAIVQTVNAYSKAIRTGLARDDHRWFLNHFTVMPPDATMQTMAEDRIGIAQQPNFLYNLEARYVATLDDWRLRHNNAIGTPAKKFGIFVALSSDNLPIGPMVGLYAAVTRKGPSGTVYGPEESVTIAEAIRMYTADAARLTFEESIKGSIEVGKLADLIVLDTDPLTSGADRLLDTKVDLTLLGGNVVYDRSAQR